MDITFDILPIIFGLSIISLIFYFLLYHRYIYSVVDPLFMFVFTTAFASVLAILVIPENNDIYHFFGCQIALWLGLVFANRKFNFLNKDLLKDKKTYYFSETYILRFVTYVLLFVYITSNLIIGYSKGFALFSDAPSSAKFANFQEGFGLFRRINWSTGTFVCTSLLFMNFIKRRTIDILFLSVVIFFSSLDGSKAALLQISISAGTVFYHPYFFNRQADLKKFRNYMPFIFAAILIIFFVILSKENDGLEESFLAFIKRLLYTSDSVIYYYTPINIDYFKSYSYGDYFSRLFNPILGFFRLQPYQEALGNTLYDNLRPPGSISTTITVGPTAPFYIESRIFFNYWFAFPYSAFVGYIYARIRIHFFSLSHSSAFYFVFMGSFFHIATAIIVDTNLAMTQLFDLIFFVIPPYIVFHFLITRKLTISLSPYLIKYIKKFNLKTV